MRKLDIIVPVKNEEQNIGELTHQLINAINTLNINYKVLFVVNEFNNDTFKELKALQKDYPISVLKKSGKFGKSYSILEGIKASNAEIIGFIDSDLQYPPNAIPTMYRKLLEEDAGVIVANRKVYKSRSRLRAIGAKANIIVLGKLLDLDCDILSGLKLFKKDITRHINTKLITHSTFDIQLLYTAKELTQKVIQHDISFEDRVIKESNATFFKDSISTIIYAIKTKGSYRKVYNLDENDSSKGLVYKQKHYVTHSNLPQHKSAIRTLIFKQKIFLLFILGIISGGVLTNVLLTVQIAIALLSTIYFLDVIFNFYVVLKSLYFPPEYTSSNEQIINLKEARLPVYTILCPLYKEWNVLPQFVKNINKIDWPKNKLEVLLLLEENDEKTIETAKRLNLPAHFKVLIVPHSMPKTKPKACNYGLNIAKGEYIVIYDAEDQPNPKQLKKAYLAFTKVDVKTVCIQAKLNYYNPSHNLLTRFFTAEYSLWFDVILPGLQSINTTIPLGGTSNHFKTKKLRELHGWDPFNVTEDCDLGARLYKEGYKTAIIDSVTLEEANSNLKNWVRQRSRWIKGYMQTYFVHMRDPIHFFKTHKLHAIVFQLVIGLRIYFMLINPILWITTLSYFVLNKYVGDIIEVLYPTYIFYMAAFSLVFGNFVYMYNYMIGCIKRKHWNLVKFALLVPVYWLLISFAAVVAFYQLIFKPYHWEKTHHGLHLVTKTKLTQKIALIVSGWTNKKYIRKNTGIPAKTLYENI